jgi:hypothetical protein
MTQQPVESNSTLALVWSARVIWMKQAPRAAGYIMLHFGLCPLVILVSSLVSGDESLQTDSIQELIEQLGSVEFAEREIAMKRLEELGPVALDALRLACQSENPEIARRSQELVRKVERKLANEKALAPTLVELDVREQPLDRVLADLSRQAGYEVVLGGSGLQALASHKVTFSTDGKKPFWTAVLSICEVEGLQIACVGGFLAPGSLMSLRGPTQPGVRRPNDPTRAIVLEPRHPKSPRRPAYVHGAVLIEAFPFPTPATGSTRGILLQVWPEPRLNWEAATGVKVAKAIDAADKQLVAETAIATSSPPFVVAADGLVIVRNPDGSHRFIRGGITEADHSITLNARQGLIKFKADSIPDLVKQLHISFFGTVRTGVEPLSQVADLVANRPTNGVGVSGIDFRLSYGRNPMGQLIATIELSYDAKTVTPAGSGDFLPGVRGGGFGTGNNTIYGVRITDAEGKPFVLGLTSGRHSLDPTSQRMIVVATLELHGDREGQRVPSRATFWGTHIQRVEIPLILQDVPINPGK